MALKKIQVAKKTEAGTEKFKITANMAFAIVAIVAVVSTVVLITYFGKAKTISDLPAEDQIDAKLGGELDSMPDVNSTELENLLMDMVK